MKFFQFLSIILPCAAFQSLSSVRISGGRQFALQSSAEAAAEDPFDAYKPGSSLAWKDTKVGDGEDVKEGDILTVAYTGYLWRNKEEFGQNEGLVFKLGGGNVMPGFDEGVRGMKVGGKRTLRVPPKLAYKEKGAGNGKIPPNADLEIEVELKSVSNGPIAAAIAAVGKTRLIGFAILIVLSVLVNMI